MFIQIIQGKCTRHEELRGQLDSWLDTLAANAPGWLGGTYGFTDDDTFVGVVRFESEEAARANAARPEQTAWWTETERCFDGPVEFHDAQRVVVLLDGGSDDAEFVQVIRGRIESPDRFESEITDMANALHAERPEIIGSTFAIEPDGTFTETVSFTTEQAAREGEQKAMPVSDEARQLWQDWAQMTQQASYLDLHHPWFASPASATGR